MPVTNLLPLLDLTEHHNSVLEEVVEGLSARPMRLSSKFFYDNRGSELFDQICELPEYYPTRTELSIMESSLPAIADWIGSGACIVEIGSGTGMKTDLLLRSLADPRAYVAIDIACSHLTASAEKLADAFPEVEISPVCADFLQPLRLPEGLPECHNHVVYFPGSTLGNLTTSEANRLLENLADLVGGGNRGLLLGVDLQKSVEVLEAAYNDSSGITSEFNLNVLRHLNDRLDATFPLDAFRHHASFVHEYNRIEMHLIANRDLEFEVGGHPFRMYEGDSILTEYSHKYDLVELSERLRAAGWELCQSWTDPKNHFAVLYCTNVE